MKKVSAGAAFFLPGADPIWSEPESTLGPRTSGAGGAQKCGGSATLHCTLVSNSLTFHLNLQESEKRIRLMIIIHK